MRRDYRAAACDRVKAFQKKLTTWLDERSERPAVTVTPGEWLEFWAYESPHEFHSDPGFATRVDVSQASMSHLNLDFYAHQGIGYPGQELLSFLILGVRYKVDLLI